MIADFRQLAACVAVTFVCLATGCSSTNEAQSVPPDPDEWQTEFDVDKADLRSRGTNPYFVLEPGHRLTFSGKEGKHTVDLVITVLDETVKVDGVETRVVEERESEDGELVEISRNFFAISARTNDVFYFGEDVDMYEDGKIESHEGAWRSGVGGAKFGLMMPGRPAVGQRFYQEIAPRVAMDRAEIVSLDEALETPAGRFERCMKVEETNPLEPKSRDHKLYARGIGLVKDAGLSLVSHGKAR